MERNLQSNRQGRPRRAASITCLLIVSFQYVALCTYALVYNAMYTVLISTTFEENNRNHAGPAWVGPCGCCPGCLALSLVPAEADPNPGTP